MAFAFAALYGCGGDKPLGAGPLGPIPEVTGFSCLPQSAGTDYLLANVRLINGGTSLAEITSVSFESAANLKVAESFLWSEDFLVASFPIDDLDQLPQPGRELWDARTPIIGYSLAPGGSIALGVRFHVVDTSADAAAWQVQVIYEVNGSKYRQTTGTVDLFPRGECPVDVFARVQELTGEK